MKKLENFFNDLKNNESLQKKLEATKDQNDALDLLKKEGYDVSKDELTEFYLENVSGGFLDVNKENWSASVVANVSGSNNVVSISGDQNLGYNYGTGGGNSNKPSVDPMAVLQMLFGNGLG